MIAGILLSLSGWLFVFLRVDPVSSGLVGQSVFFLTLGLTLIGIFSTVGVLVRVLILPGDHIIHREVVHSFRHACFFSVLILANLLLAATGLLRWWTTTLLIFIFALLEVLFGTSRHRTF